MIAADGLSAHEKVEEIRSKWAAILDRIKDLDPRIACAKSDDRFG
jgi:hypothetical protein